MKTARLKAKEERRLLRGHLWAYRNEFQSVPELDDGEVLDVVSDQGRFVGRGFFQATGGIAVRLLAHEQVDIDESFFGTRIDEARRFRERIYPGESTYRWIFGDSDGLPGLIADRYGPLVVTQAGSSFYKSHAATIADAFLAHEDIEGVLLKTGDESREFGQVELPVSADIHGLVFTVDPLHGQKTGLFLDQRENWTLVERYAAGAQVLDAHCYTGAWGLHAARHGAARVLGVDTSRPAIDTATRNAERNGLTAQCSFERADVRQVLARDAVWDVIVLDPPALAKSRAHLTKARGLYQALNRDAMKSLAPGGILITSSCSQPLDPAAFLETLKRAATSAQRRVQVLETRGAAPDHPALLAMPETSYLNCVVLRVVA